jgi:hypothetical protein
MIFTYRFRLEVLSGDNESNDVKAEQGNNTVRTGGFYEPG